MCAIYLPIGKNADQPSVGKDVLLKLRYFRSVIPAGAEPRIKCGINSEPGSSNFLIPGQARNDGLRSFIIYLIDRPEISGGAHMKLRSKSGIL